MASCHTVDHGWVVYPCLSMFVLIGLYTVPAPVARIVSSGFILPPPPYWIVNAGLYDSIKQCKKNSTVSPLHSVNL